AQLKLAMGYRREWLGIEGILMPMFGGRLGDKTTLNVDTSTSVELGYPKFGFFAGVGGRVSSVARVARVTGARALGLSVQQLADKLLKCNGSCGMGNNDSGKGVGYATAALVGDVGLTLGGGSPSAKFWIGLDWFLDFTPDLVVNAAGLPSKFV